MCRSTWNPCPLRKGEVQLPVNRLDLTTDVQHAPRIVDVLGTQSEHFTLTKSASQAEYDSHPVSRTDHVSDFERPLQQPRLSTLPRRLGPLHGLRMHRVPGEALVINGSLQDAGQLGQDAAPVVDRGDGGLQLRYVCAKFRRRDAPERQLAQMRHDVKSRPPLLVLLGFRNSSPARRPVHRDVVGQCDGSVARVNEFTALLVRGCPTKPRLGILQGIEGTVPDPGYARDPVSLALTVASSSLPFPRYWILLLRDPAIFYVAGQIVSLSKGERRSTTHDASDAGGAAGPILRSGAQRAQSRVGAGIGLFLFTDPGIQSSSPVHDAASWPHAEARRPLPPVPPHVERVG